MSEKTHINLSIDRKHQEIIDSFDTNDKSLSKLKKKKKDILKKLNSLENNISNLKNDEFIEVSMDISHLKSELVEINQKLTNIELRKEETEYFLKTTPVLYEYYKEISTNETINDESTQKQCIVKKNNLTSQHRFKPKTVLDFFGQSNLKTEDDDVANTNIINNKIIKSDISNKRGDMLYKYLNIVDPIKASKKKRVVCIFVICVELK